MLTSDPFKNMCFTKFLHLGTAQTASIYESCFKVDFFFSSSVEGEDQGLMGIPAESQEGTLFKRDLRASVTFASYLCQY